MSATAISNPPVAQDADRALARKLLIALWRLAHDGIVPEGVQMRPA